MRKALALGAGLLASLAAGNGQARDAMVVLDGSGSMWGQIEGTNKIVIAREVLDGVIRDWPRDAALGLTAYGHRRKGDCGDIETLIDVGPVAPDAFMERVNAINPKGKTPLTDAVEHAARALRYREEAATVVLVSDGLETCDRDPCSAGETLERNGIDFTTHVVGFDVTGEADQAQLRCLADATGGQFFTAANASELRAALDSVRQQTTAPPPEPPAVTVEAPDAVTVGSRFTVRWDPTAAESDVLTIVPADADPDTIDNHARARRGTPVELRAPAEPGDYQVRYVSDDPRRVLGHAPVTLTEAEVELDVPERVSVGTRFEVGFDNAVDASDYLTVVPADAETGEVGNHARVRGGQLATLRAPGEAGAYEVRYVLDEGRRTVAREPLTVVDKSVTVEAAAKAKAGSAIEIEWSRTVSENDFLTIVPADAAAGTIGNHARAGNDSPMTLQVPGEPGDYEVRYVLDEGRRVLGRAPVAVSRATVSVEAPASATIGSGVEVRWTGTVSDRDILTIVPADAPDDAVGNHRRAGNGSPLTLRAPSKPGDYQVRYVLDEGRRPMARTPISLTEPEVSITAAERTKAGSALEVSWTGTVSDRDILTMVPADAPDDAVGNHRRAGNGSPLTLRAPGEPGDYEVRYVLDEGRRLMARTPVTLTEPEVSVTAPETAKAGSAIHVAWEGTVSRRDMLTVVPADSADDTVGNHARAGNGSPLNLRVPGEAGRYEVRYVLDEGRRALARAPVAVSMPGVRVAGPQSVAVDSPVSIEWEGTVHRSDYLTIVPADAPDDEIGRHARAGNGSPVTLRSPKEPGAYEIRYVLDAGRVLIARQGLQVTAP